MKPIDLEVVLRDFKLMPISNKIYKHFIEATSHISLSFYTVIRAEELAEFLYDKRWITYKDMHNISVQYQGEYISIGEL